MFRAGPLTKTEPPRPGGSGDGSAGRATWSWFLTGNRRTVKCCFCFFSYQHRILEKAGQTLIKTISDVTETHAPLQTASRRQKRLQKQPWITKGILISIKSKQKLYKTFFLGGSDFEKSFYKIYANKLTTVKNLSKKLYYHSAIADRNSNPRELWKFI